MPLDSVQKTRLLRHRFASVRGSDEPRWVKRVLIAFSIGFMLIFLLLPLVNVFVQAWESGGAGYLAALNEPNTRAAIRLTLTVAAISVPLNLSLIHI